MTKFTIFLILQRDSLQSFSRRMSRYHFGIAVARARGIRVLHLDMVLGRSPGRWASTERASTTTHSLNRKVFAKHNPVYITGY